MALPSVLFVSDTSFRSDRNWSLAEMPKQEGTTLERLLASGHFPSIDDQKSGDGNGGETSAEDSDAHAGLASALKNQMPAILALSRIDGAERVFLDRPDLEIDKPKLDGEPLSPGDRIGDQWLVKSISMDKIVVVDINSQEEHALTLFSK